MRSFLLTTLLLGLLAAPALAQQGTMAVSVRILPTLAVPGQAAVVADAPAAAAEGQVALAVKRGWTWSLRGAVGASPVDVGVKLCRSGHCADRAESGAARRASGALLLAVRLPAAEPSTGSKRGTLTYLIAPL